VTTGCSVRTHEPVSPFPQTARPYTPTP
jgi:hypothetical protein